MCRRRLEIGISLHRGPIGEPGVGGPFTRNFERYLKEGSGNGASLSVEALSGEPGGGLLYWGPRTICKGRLWKQAFLFIGAPLGNLEYAHLPGTLRDGERAFWKHIISFCGSSVMGTRKGGGPLVGTLKDM